jgi:hypothetical protein
MGLVWKRTKKIIKDKRWKCKKRIVEWGENEERNKEETKNMQRNKELTKKTWIFFGEFEVRN